MLIRDPNVGPLDWERNRVVPYKCGAAPTRPHVCAAAPCALHFCHPSSLEPR